MPVGVPKVPFRAPGDEDATWVDLYNRLYRERLLFLAQDINNEIANQLMGLMVYLSAEDANKEIFSFINCPGGSVIPGVGLYRMMQAIVPDVNTICMGVAASMGSFILIGGEMPKRIALPHARVMIHQPASSYYDGSAADFHNESKHVTLVREYITECYIERTGQPEEVIQRDLNRDVFMSATEAQAYGIVDVVAEDPLIFNRFLK
uniref:ATP-dependent Clp protease proteolytic subunit n=1 Tax=Pinus contorta TaxID=3339 RepID=CLPP_PINCO|nr:RecName: Full=ATP-dependent Clp protease proteolytic subunit; AltName: Full=Endopeptidase Clp [Pinus contorta]AAA68094.1 ATP-dependent protease proteolytic subunit [Pinus contorta]